MKRTRNTFIAVVTLVLSAVPAFAHDGIEHVLGTLKEVSATSITVETTNHKTTAIALDATTTYTNKGEKASLKDLKAGVRVAVDTKDDANDKPHAVSVKWGAAPAAAKAATGKAMPKMDPNMKM